MPNNMRRVLILVWSYINILLHGLILFTTLLVVDWNTVNEMGPDKLGVQPGSPLYSLLTNLFTIYLFLSLAFLIFTLLTLALKWKGLWVYLLQGLGILIALGLGLAVFDLLIIDDDWVQGLPLLLGWKLSALSLAAMGMLIIVFVIDRKSWAKRLLALVVVAIALAAPCAWVFRPLEFSALPSVFDTGKAWTVVWATSLPASGQVNWVDPDGITHSLSDQQQGFDRVNIRWHQVDILKDAAGKPIERFQYQVTSIQTRFQFANFFRAGGTVTSPEYAFSALPLQADKVTLMVVSDIHSAPAKAAQAASQLGDFDLLLMLGDYSTAYFSEDDIYKNVLGPAHDMSAGVRPVFAARGNHENRGTEAWRLNEIVPRPNDSWYYAFDYHGLSAVMLDTGDDFHDDEAIYGGHAHFQEYLAQETAWLEAIPPATKAQWRLAFGHFPVKSSRSQDYYSEALWYHQLERLGVAAMIHGHTHQAGDFNPPGTDAVYALTSDGGSIHGHFVATRVTLDNGGIHWAQASELEVLPNNILSISSSGKN